MNVVVLESLRRHEELSTTRSSEVLSYEWGSLRLIFSRSNCAVELEKIDECRT